MSFFGFGMMAKEAPDALQMLPDAPKARKFVVKALLEMLETQDEHDVMNNKVIVVDMDSSEKWFHYKCDTFPDNCSNTWGKARLLDCRMWEGAPSHHCGLAEIARI